ncbi:hypothetical protein D3C81_1296920 [compost metagenome]
MNKAHRLVLAIATQVQADLRRYPGTEATVGRPRGLAIITARRQRLALDVCLTCGLPERGWQWLCRWQQLFLITRDEPGIQLGAGEGRVGEDTPQEGDVGL